MWYDNTRILSYNKLFNFVIGNRGGGKTFNAKNWCIKDYKKHKNKFLWIRRYEKELKKVDRFFDDIRSFYPDDVFRVDGYKCYINDEMFGEFIQLSTASFDKGVASPDTNKLIFDEFIIDKGSIHYLKNEVDKFLELFETVARMRNNTRALFLGNAISIINPYFLYWNIKPDLNKRFNMYDLIAVEFYADADYIKEKNKTKFGQLVMGTNYGDYAINNDFLRDNNTFIGKKTAEADFMLSLKYAGVIYGYWVDYKAGYIYVNRQYDPYSYNQYSLTKDDHAPNLLLIKSLKGNKHLERIIYAFENGLLLFDDMQTKNQFYEYIHYFIR